MASDPLRIPAEDLRRFTAATLQAAGASLDDATVVAEALVWSDLRARHPQGVRRLQMLVDRLQVGQIQSPAAISWTTVTPSVERLDAANAFGHVAGRLAMERAIALAKTHGLGATLVRRSNLYGAAGFFCAQAVTADCLGFTCTNALAKVAPFGGIRPVLGTNPLAFGCPTRSRGPIVVDLSTSAMAGSDLREMVERGERLPPGVALDRHGAPTVEPAEAADGCLLPAAGPKGFGLGLMVEILSGVLTGAAMAREVGSIFDRERPTNTGHFFLAIDITRFYEIDRFLDRIEELLGWIKESSRAGDEVVFPGEARERVARDYEAYGIPLGGETIDVLERLARRFGTATPWA